MRRAGAAASGPTPSSTAVAARANTPEPVSCQLAGSRRRGASVKNWLAWVARRIAFQPSGPVAVASTPARMTVSSRGRARAARATPATTADRAAPYRMEAQLSIASRLLVDALRTTATMVTLYFCCIRGTREGGDDWTGCAAGRLGPVRVAWAVVLLAYRLPREPSNPRVGVW